ncbi:MAG TPA: AAA family ATPase [Pseudonocardia sp.]|nr:AAA family ATPase [Pseudonocardia sp.]
MASNPAERLYVVVSGAPASGKSTLAAALAPELGLPLLAKDTIKQALLTVLDVPDVEASRTVGRAAAVALLAVAAEAGSAVLEAPWQRSRAVTELAGLPGRLVEVFCRCSPETAAARFAARAATRDGGHFDHDRTPAELWNDQVAAPVDGGWPVLVVDTEVPVDVAELADRVRSLARSRPAAGPGR